MSILWLIWPWLVVDSFLRFGLVCLRALRAAAPVWPETEAENGCVVLIAAHEEEGTIGPTVAALRSQLCEWPGSRLWVVADRCHDGTAAEAEGAGAQVARRSDGRLGKGSVIAWWLEKCRSDWRENEVIVVLDADSRLEQGSLRALRRAMASGADAAQAFIAPNASTRSGRLAGWSEVLMQRIDDEARRRCHWPVPLRGTGMALRAGLLAELAPRLHTLAEDLELDAMLAARGARVLFVPEAVVYDPKPAHAAGASRQRARWLQGQLQVLRDYGREIRQALLARGLGAWFLIWLIMLRPKTFFIALRLVMLVTTFPWGPWWLALTALMLDVVYYLAGALIVDDRRRYLLDLLAAPRYVAMWFFSFGTAMVRRGWLKAGR